MKIFIKWNVLGFVTQVFIFCFGARINKDGWEDRVLIVDLHGIGDVIMATPTLRYYRKHFSGKKIYLLVAQPVSKDVFGDDIDFLLATDSRKFGINPWYAMKTVNRFREIGFASVVNECLSIKDKASKVISISLGGKNVFGYEGIGVELVNPLADPFRRYAERHINPHYTTLVPSIDKDFRIKNIHPKSAILHHLAICKAVTGVATFPDVSTVFHVDDASVASAREKLTQLGAKGARDGKYVALVMGANDEARRWELSKFAEVAEAIHQRGFEIILVGSRSEYHLGESFGQNVSFTCINAIGILSLLENAAVIRDAHCLISNDTGPVHIAIALATPSICILGGAHVGVNSLYGRPEINRWVFKDIGCLYDDWRCVATIPAGSPAPCITAISALDVIQEFSALEKHLATQPNREPPFVAEFDRAQRVKL